MSVFDQAEKKALDELARFPNGHSRYGTRLIKIKQRRLMFRMGLELGPRVSEIVARILRENERAFCIVSDEYQEGGHPLPIYRVDENGRGIECERADVLVVRDRRAIAMIGGKAFKRAIEASTGPESGCLYYEFGDAEEAGERGPYEIVLDTVHLPYRGFIWTPLSQSHPHHQ